MLVIAHPYVNLFLVTAVIPVCWRHHPFPLGVLSGMLWHETNETWENGGRLYSQGSQHVGRQWGQRGISPGLLCQAFSCSQTLLAAPW